jgi:cytochrome c-type biogenesis protein CcmF
MSGHLLLTLAALAAGGALLAAAMSLTAGRQSGKRNDQRVWSSASRHLTWLLAIFLTGALLYLALLLATGDFSVRYVWQHSASYQSLGHRLSALLAGQEGTLILWSFLTAIAALVATERCARRRPLDAGGAKLIHVILLAIVLVLLLITMRSAPFQLFAEAFVEAGAIPVEGRGLNPVLQNPWMPPHTLFTFVSYAAIGLAFALGLLQLIRSAQGRFAEAERWSPALLNAVRWSWLVLSLALLTGLVWAYEEMTFGWFWSWDPVEAATLAIWLVLTACLHAPRRRSASRRATLVAPFLAAFAMVAVVFASFFTRSGLHPSVHAFASGTTGWYLGGFLLLLVLTLGLGFGWAWQRASREDRGRHLQDRPVSWKATGLLFAASILIMWGLSYPMLAGLLGRTIELDPTFFNLWGYLLALALLFLVGFELKGSPRRDKLPLLGVFIVLTVIAAFVKPTGGLELLSAERGFGSGPLIHLLGRVSVLSLLPPVIYALLAVLERWWSRTSTASRQTRARESGLAMIHAGFVVALVGITLSTLFTSTVTVTVNPLMNQPSSQGGVGVRIMDLNRSETADARGMVVEQREFVDLEVYVGGALVSSGQAQLFTYPQRGMGRHVRVLLDRGLSFDTQVIYHGLAEMNSGGIPVTVRRIPFISLVWGGLILFIAGFTLVMGSRLFSKKSSLHGERKLAT